MIRRMTFALGLAALTAGCADLTGPDAGLDEADIQLLTREADAVIMGFMDDVFSIGVLAPTDAPSLVADPVVRSYSFERSRECAAGGTVTITGSGTRTHDPDARTHDVTSAGTRTRTDCARARGDVTITMNGSSAWTHERHFLERAPTGTWITTSAGSFTWSKSTGREGSCTFALTSTVDTAANTRTVAGTFCGRDVERTGTWRDG